MRPKQSLLQDRRGAIVVMAVFMAAFMCGCIWYLMGVGDAAVYREKMQASSDATAYVSAVYHARGMNLIVLLNLIMAAALAVLIALKIAQIISGIIAIGAAIVCAIPFGEWACPIAAGASDVWDTLTNTIIPRVQDIVNKILSTCSHVEYEIALVTPDIAAARSVATGVLDYQPVVKGGVAVSPSMIPGRLLGTVRIGLPVQEMYFSTLCKRAGTILGNGVFGLGGLLPGVGSFAGGLIGNLAGTFPQYFCGGGGWFPGEHGNTLDENLACGPQSKQDYNEHKKKGDPAWDKQKCLDNLHKTQNDKSKVQESNQKNGIKDVKDTSQERYIDSLGRTAKEVYTPAYNGSDYFQVFAVTIGENGWTHRSEKGVEMPAWGNDKVNPGGFFDKALESLSISEAEFYYDEKGKWGDYSGNATWNFYWRARLRRFRLPQPSLGAALINKFMRPVRDLFRDKLGDNLISAELYKLISKYPLKAGHAVDSKIDGFIGGLTDGFIIH